MKHKIKLSIIPIIALAILSSCSSAGLNFSKSTPRKGYDYPKFTQKDSIKGSLNAYRTCFDVKEYLLSIDINPEKKYIKGFVNIGFVAVSETKTIQIDLFKNMKLDSITCEGKLLNYTRKYNAVYVNFENPLTISEYKSIRCYYQGKPIEAPRPPWEGGFVWKKSKDGSAWIGVACELIGASLWWPCKDHISDEPENGVTLNVTVPEGLQVVSNGILVHQTKINNKETFTWKTQYPINIYNVTVNVGKFEHFSEKYDGVDTTFTLDYYMLPEYTEKAKEIFKQTAGILKFYEEIYGPYPWPREGYKLVGSPYEGMEHQTAIAYGNGFRTHKYGFDYIILHESAHEWWGNSVSAPDFADIFMHEGFATYSELLYVERTYGKNAAKDYMQTYSWYIKNKNPVVGPRNVAFWDYKDTDPYMKGAWTLHGLRFIIDNDSLFFDILKSFYLQNAYSIVTTQDFINFVHAKTNKNFDWYFKQYLYKREAPRLEYTVKNIGADLEIELVWKDVESNFELPLEILVNDTPIRITPSTQVQRYIFTSFDAITFNTYNAYYSIKKVEKIK